MPMSIQTIQFIRCGETVSLANVPPSRTLLELLREDLGCSGTKEGCNEGDCGACTVVLAELDPANGSDPVRYRAVNSCIRLAHSIDGMALWTVEDLTSDPLLHPSQAEGGPGARSATTPPVRSSGLHPAQQAMLQCHGSQCGFCTPGFVMSLFGLYQNQVCRGETVTRALAQEALSGNLCRCTGYRPILDAAQAMAALPPMALDETVLLQKLKQLSHKEKALEASLSYLSPTTLAALLAARASHPDAQLVAGCTDVGLWVTKQHQQFDQVLDVTRVQELRRIEHYPHHIAIGAAVTLNDAFDALVSDRPQLGSFARRFAGLPVRNAGTLGGNVANGSPIGDSMPLLIALGASVVLMSRRGHRELPLEQLYSGYRQTVLRADEVLAWIKVPRSGSGSPHPGPLPRGEGERQRGMTPSPLWGEGWGEGQELLRVYKISKRFDDDISAVCLALQVNIEDGRVITASIGAGGVAATPVRAVKTEAALTGRAWTQATVRDAMITLRAEFEPLSDMRASASYRREVLGNLLQRFWLESQGLQHINLESFSLEGAAA
jgi:xanthine dehydrogenase small subunit